MTYEQALQFIHGIERFGSKPGLRRVQMLLERMGNPQDRLRFVHVAGTNGKGSTCAMLSHALARAGYRTGLYISPFVLDFRERIQLDNRMISRADLAACTELVKSHWDELNAAGETPTEFEVVVAVAMEYFVRQKADIVVLEVGMGGRFDATNVIGAPLVSVITSISYDHTEYLGDTIEQIAMEKCGIIKPGGVTVSYPEQDPRALEVILRRCAEEGNELRIPLRAEIISQDLAGSRFRYGGHQYHVPLIGAHQVRNAITVLETLDALAERGFPVLPAAGAAGIAGTRFPSRLEVLCRRPLLLLDGAHNPGGARVLADALGMLGAGRVHAVMGMLQNKDVRACLEQILPHCASLTAVATPASTKAMPPEQLAALAAPLCPDVRACGDAEQGVRSAWAHCGRDDALLVCGSLYLAAHLRPLLLELGRQAKTGGHGGQGFTAPAGPTERQSAEHATG